MEETLAKPQKIHVKVNGVKVMVIYYSLHDGEEINVKEHQYKGDEADLLEALEKSFTDAKTINL
jgi:ribosomal protein S4